MMRHFFVLLFATGLIASTGCSSLFDPCDAGESGDESHACFATECRVDQSCDVSQKVIAGSAMPFTAKLRETPSDTSSFDLTSDDEDVLIEGAGSCSPDCTWSGTVKSGHAGTVTLRVNGEATDGSSDRIDMHFEKAATVTATVVHDGLSSDPEVDKDASGVAQVSVSDRDIQLRLVARDGHGDELRAFPGAYQVTPSTSGNNLTTREASGIVPSGDKYALALTRPGDVVLHVSTTNDDGVVTIDVPLHITP